jgi:hypothetical protein
LDERVDFRALLAFERGTDFSSVLELSQKYFVQVSQVVYDPYSGSTQDWPHPQNWAFQSTCREIKALARKDPFYQQGWLWWESDAVPVRKGWLQDIAAEFSQCGKPFMGHIREMTPGHPHMNGAGCYPWNVSDYSQAALLARSVPWDVAARDEISRHAANANHLFQHVWGDTSNQALTFPDQRTVGHKVHLKGALFHRNKDGTLADRLLERVKPPKPPPPPPTPEAIEQEAKKQTWIEFLRGRIAKGRKREKLVKVPFLLKTRRGKIIHIVEKHYVTERSEHRRLKNAFDSWVELYKTGIVVPCHCWNPPRISESVGDFRKLPFLKDILVEGLTLARDRDWLMLTNDDTILHPKLPGLLMDLPAGIEAVSSFRIEFDQGSPISTDMEPSRLAKEYDRDLGRDLFAFSAEWIKEHWFEIPDFLLGEIEWDLIMTLLIRDTLGIVTDHTNILMTVPEVEMPMGYVLHERHQRKWMQVGYNNPAKLWNKRLAKAWCNQRGYNYPITAPKKALVLEHPNEKEEVA